MSYKAAECESLKHIQLPWSMYPPSCMSPNMCAHQSNLSASTNMWRLPTLLTMNLYPSLRTGQLCGTGSIMLSTKQEGKLYGLLLIRKPCMILVHSPGIHKVVVTICIHCLVTLPHFGRPIHLMPTCTNMIWIQLPPLHICSVGIPDRGGCFHHGCRLRPSNSTRNSG